MRAELPQPPRRRAFPLWNFLPFLCAAQLRAAEPCWYLRLVEGTPHIFDLYKNHYPRTSDLLAALGLDREEIKDFVAT